MENFTRYYYTDTNFYPYCQFTSPALFAVGTSFTAQVPSHTTDTFQRQIINLRKKWNKFTYTCMCHSLWRSICGKRGTKAALPPKQ